MRGTRGRSDPFRAGARGNTSPYVNRVVPVDGIAQYYRFYTSFWGPIKNVVMDAFTY